MQPSNTEIQVMLVDDSGVIRGALKRLFESSPHIRVIKSLGDGNLSISAAERLKPHIVILDIEMPIMDGLTALPQILKASPETKVIMFSSLTEKGAKVTMEAMRLGAVECIVKPSSAQDVGEGSPFQKQIISLIESLVPPHKRRAIEGDNATAATATATAPAATTALKPSLISGEFTLKNDPLAYKNKPSIVAIGSSTGGPQALFNVLKHCKGFDVPIVITQHMPATFTKILAEHIEQQIGITAHEGANGMAVEAGKVYVAPGGYHMLFENSGGALTIKLDEGPAVNFCKPAVDPMFESLIQAYGQRVLGVILTGMGHDGREGCKKLVEQHGRVIAQDEATSVVWGMPGAVAQANVCCEVLPLDKIGPWIHSAVMK